MPGQASSHREAPLLATIRPRTTGQGDSVTVCRDPAPGSAPVPAGVRYSDFKYSTSSRFWAAERFSLKWLS